MKVAYIQWRDASYSADEWATKDISLQDLPAVGFLVKEDDESVTLTMEPTEDLEKCRFWVCIPKVNIKDMRVRELDQAFPKPRRKSK